MNGENSDEMPEHGTRCADRAADARTCLRSDVGGSRLPVSCLQPDPHLGKAGRVAGARRELNRRGSGTRPPGWLVTQPWNGATALRRRPTAQSGIGVTLIYAPICMPASPTRASSPVARTTCSAPSARSPAASAATTRRRRPTRCYSGAPTAVRAPGVRRRARAPAGPAARPSPGRPLRKPLRRLPDPRVDLRACSFGRVWTPVGRTPAQPSQTVVRPSCSPRRAIFQPCGARGPRGFIRAEPCSRTADAH